MALTIGSQVNPAAYLTQKSIIRSITKGTAFSSDGENIDDNPFPGE
jgi:hypothetical protein